MSSPKLFWTITFIIYKLEFIINSFRIRKENSLMLEKLLDQKGYICKYSYFSGTISLIRYVFVYILGKRNMKTKSIYRSFCEVAQSKSTNYIHSIQLVSFTFLTSKRDVPRILFTFIPSFYAVWYFIISLVVLQN